MKYLTIKQVCQKLGSRSRASIYRDIEAGRLPEPIKFGARVYFREGYIDEAMNNAEGTRESV